VITVPDRIDAMIREIKDYLDNQDLDDVRIEITGKGVYVQKRDCIRAYGDRRFKR